MFGVFVMVGGEGWKGCADWEGLAGRMCRRNKEKAHLVFGNYSKLVTFPVVCVVKGQYSHNIN